MLDTYEVKNTVNTLSSADFHLQNAHELRSETASVMFKGLLNAIKKAFTFELPAIFTGPLANR